LKKRKKSKRKKSKRKKSKTTRKSKKRTLTKKTVKRTKKTILSFSCISKPARKPPSDLLGGFFVRKTKERSVGRAQNDYYRRNRERIIARQKAYYRKNKRRILEWHKQHYARYKGEYLERGKRSNEQRKADPKRRLSSAVGNLMTLDLGEMKRGIRWPSLVPWTLNDLVEHLEVRFSKGMTWDNYGGPKGWSLDHICPRSSFVFDSPYCEAFQKCWSLENLQPLWRDENTRKHWRYRKAQS
jgi:hypothetical protein